MFGGINALGYPRDRLYVSPADKLARFEFSDRDCVLRGFLLHERQRSHGQRRSGRLGDIFAHALLYRHYPELAAAPFELEWSAYKEGAQCRDEKLFLFLPPAEPALALRRRLCHESQHLIQLIENFSAGGSSAAIFNELAQQHRTQTGQKHPGHATRRQLEAEAYRRYRSLPGEMEAFDVGQRLDWDDAQRAATPPVNARLSAGADGVSFTPRAAPAISERLALAYFSRTRQRLLKAEAA